MKICAYCGRENQDDAIQCSECATTEFKTSGPPTPSAPVEQVRWRFAQVSAAEMNNDFVTLVTCQNLPEADLVVNHLEGAGIEAFIPDESAMQNAAFLLNLASGFVRVQVSRRDYESAKEFLNALSKD